VPRYLSAEQLQWIHRRVIDATGGSHAVRDLNLVQSAAVRPSAGAEKLDTYPTLPEKTAALLESLVLYHPFVDGNRRTALVAAGVFLEYNRRRLEFTPAEADRFLRRVGTGKMPFREVARWLERHSSGQAVRRGR
jgi:death-on-curing protein